MGLASHGLLRDSVSPFADILVGILFKGAAIVLMLGILSYLVRQCFGPRRA